MKMDRLTLQKHQAQGFTLIELLVSMTLSLFLLGGMMSMYFGSRTADKTRTELGDIEANARVALTALREGIQHAGYSSLSYTPLEKPFHTPIDGSIDNPTCRDGGKLILSGSTTTSGGITTTLAGLTQRPTELTGYTQDNLAGDVITVIMRPDNPNAGGPIYFDCGTMANSNNTFVADSINHAYQTSTSTQAEDIARQTACSTDVDNGMHDPFEAKMYSAFFLKQNTGRPKQLMCYGSRSSSSTPTIIADNIDNMQIRYGVLTGATAGAGGSVTFKTANQVEALAIGGWESVISVQVAILVGSDNQDVLTNPASRTFKLLDRTITKPASDHRMYKVYSTTINLPNRAQRDF